MRVLHTSDWHLGKRLEQCERTDEHQHFLDWLVQTIQAQQVEVLVIAGDIFDTGSPSNTALKQYYDFLWRLRNSGCREIIIIGGNHDSVSTLNAPKALLRYFNVHVIGGATADIREEIIPVADTAGNTRLVVCAVPFLRDKDIRLSVPGETYEEQEVRLKRGICAHYEELVEHIELYKQQGIPVMAMGHLFAAGSSASDSEKEIHVGNLGQICGDQFPAAFDYVALGHLHRPQKVNGFQHIRYSGSPIPLSFSEVEDKKIIIILDFADGQLTRLEEVQVPVCRKLVRFRGDLDKIRRHITTFDNSDYPYPAWVEIQVETENFIHDLDSQLQDFLGGKNHLQFFTRQVRLAPAQALETTLPEMQQLHELQPKDVFRKKCETAFPAADENAFSDLLSTFDELLELMHQQESK
ncbi:nuclease SbcCD subunit D [Adhaeribacter aerolatus]|uniref:Nuclease SbcCD subunit D n=1 Tax=Adhaeribacter aerolatus TaxID=670289 RepID=A0A512ASL6_9BACT|nr:exonuclease SbcCD subunit D C-terminal domain-containing protein [Adhaeribacter aerolatus]GEO02703.1 nuclease SbcCD subunit D [Adhaeribacter aerolatus]